MASITLIGSLLDPGGSASIGDQVRFTHKSNTGSTIKSAVSTITIPPDGSYNITLQYGVVRVEYKDILTGVYKDVGVVTVNQDSTATTLPELLNAVVPPTDDQLLEFQAILADCVDAQNNAAQSLSEVDALTGQQTTTELINSTVSYDADKVLETSGFTTAGDGGNGKWKQNGVTGQTPSQTPAQLGDALLNDASGNQWALIKKSTNKLESLEYPLTNLSCAIAGASKGRWSCCSPINILAGFQISQPCTLDFNNQLVTIVNDIASDGQFFTCSADDVKVTRFILDADINNKSNLNALITNSGDSFTISHSEFNNVPGISIFSGICKDTKIIKNDFNNCGTKNLQTSNLGDRRQAVALMTVASPRIKDNTFNGVGLDCISVATNSTDAIVTGNECNDNHAGCIYISSCVGFVLSGNIINLGDGNGYDIINSKNGSVSDSNIKNRGAAGLLIADGCKDITVNGLNLFNNGTKGDAGTAAAISIDSSGGDAPTGITIATTNCYDTRAGTSSVTQLSCVDARNLNDDALDIKIDASCNFNGYSSSGATSDTNKFKFDDGQLPAFGVPIVKNFIANEVQSIVLLNSTKQVSIEVFVQNTNQVIKYSTRGLSSPTITFDQSNIATNTDSGSGIAIYEDSGVLKIKNRYGLTRAICYKLNS